MFAAMALAGMAVAAASLLMVRWTALSGPLEPLQSARPQSAELAKFEGALLKDVSPASSWKDVPSDAETRNRWWRDVVARGQRAACEGEDRASLLCSPTLGNRTALLDRDGRVIAGSVPHPLLIAFASINTWQVPLTLSGSPIGSLQIADPGNPRDDLATAFLIQRQSRLCWASGTALLLMAAAAAWLAWRFRRPIRQLQEGTHGLANGRFDLRLPAARSDELGDLARSFNRMAERLQALDAAQRQWISDSAHELRTPLAVLQAQIEALLDGVRPATPQQLQLTLRQTRSLARLVGDLHALALGDAGGVVLQRQPCDAGALLEQAVAAFAGRAASAGLSLRLLPTPPCVVDADPDRLQQVFDNLLENGVRYAAAGGQVVIEARLVERGLELAFDDSGPGVSPDLLARLGERFFRADGARSRDGGEGGSGLGLALCRQIVAMHAGDIAFLASPLGGLRVLVTLPLASRGA